MNVNEIKKSAREHLKGNWKNVVLFVFCFILIECIINVFFFYFSFSSNEDFMDSSINNILVNVFNVPQRTANKINSGRHFITNIASNTTSSDGLKFQLPPSINSIILVAFVVKIIIEIPLLYGFTISLMKFKRGKDIGIFSFLENDNLQFKRAWKIELKRISVLILPIILLLFISISTALNYNHMIRYRRYLAPFGAYNSTSFATRFIIDIILLIACSIYYYTQKLKYILSFKVSLDEPDLPTNKVIEKSKTLMMGHRKEYFILQLSFIGWEILGYLTFGIGYLWITPYIQLSTVCFYDKLKENKQI